jgi:hypothetical protein
MSTTYRRSPQAIWRSSAGLLVAAVPPNPPTRVAGSAAIVWRHLSAPITLDDLVAQLSRETGATVDALRADVVSLFEALVPLGLVEVDG